jgi:predicted O-methyltransferase YrrM
MNTLWIQAIEQAEAGRITHFLMQHSDIVPEMLYLDKMVAIMEKTGADVLSAIVPIKDNFGFTSTALDEPVGDWDPYWRVRRLTLHEVFNKYPPTFTGDTLLLNTGLMLVDMTKEWTRDTENVYFTLEDRIKRYRGRRMAFMMPEDWGFSRMARKKGAKLYATREIKLEHYGPSAYSNAFSWGTQQTDFLPPPIDPVVDAAVLEASKVDGYMAEDELRYLAEQAKKAIAIVEVGSWKGRSTKALAMATPGVVYAVDNWKGSPGGDATELEAQAKGAENIFEEFKRNLAPEIAAGKVVVIHADHASAADVVRDRLGGNVADMVFIDGEHNYEAVKRDLLNFLPLVKQGGLMCGHDLCEAHPGVEKAVSEVLPEATVRALSIWGYDMDGVWAYPGCAQEC